MGRTCRSIFYVLTGVFLAKTIGVFTSFFVARTLQPSNYGVWLVLVVIASYSGIAHLGTLEAFMKDYPYYLGQKDSGRAQELEENALGSVMLAATLILAGGSVLMFFSNFEETTKLADSVSFMFITAIALGLLSTFFYNRFLTHQEFKCVSLIDTSRAVCTFVFLVSLTYWRGLNGTVCGYFLTELCICILSVVVSVRMMGMVKARFNRSLIWQMIRVGLPITFVWWVFILQSTLDRMVSITMLGKAETGYYGLGVSIITALLLVPQVVGRVLYPKINEGLGERLEKKQMALLVVAPASLLSIILPLLIGSLILLLPAIYSSLFPKYLPGLVSAQILLLGSFFLCMIRSGANFLVATGLHKKLLCSVLGSMALNLTLTITLIKLGFKIEGIAVSASLSGVLLSTLVWTSVFKEMGYSRIEQLKELCYLYLPFIMLLLLIGILMPFVDDVTITTHPLILAIMVLFAVSFIASAQLVPRFNKATKDLYHLVGASLQRNN